MRAQGCRNTRGVAWLWGIALMSFPSAFAANVETLLMPGKVSRAHIKQENDCANCHDRSNVKTQSSLCVDCPKPIAADLKQHQGYHGRMTNAGVGECRACHTEHKGRDADIVQLSRAQSDHHLTNFVLEGAHQALPCAACHKKGEAWLTAPAGCVGCHKNDDVPHGQFTQSCGE